MIMIALTVTLLVLTGLTLMQILLIAGRPFGSIAWGGQHRVLPPRLRIAAVGAIVLYVGFAALLTSRAGLLPGGNQLAVIIGTWILFAYCTASIVLNAISRSRNERLVQIPVSALLSLGVLVIAISPGT